MPAPDLPPDFHIIVRWDSDEQRVVFDLADMDDFSAITVLRQVVGCLEDRLPYPRDINDPVEAFDDDED